MPKKTTMTHDEQLGSSAFMPNQIYSQGNEGISQRD